MSFSRPSSQALLLLDQRFASLGFSEIDLSQYHDQDYPASSDSPDASNAPAPSSRPSHVSTDADDIAIQISSRFNHDLDEYLATKDSDNDFPLPIALVSDNQYATLHSPIPQHGDIYRCISIDDSNYNLFNIANGAAANNDCSLIDRDILITDNNDNDNDNENDNNNNNDNDIDIDIDIDNKQTNTKAGFFKNLKKDTILLIFFLNSLISVICSLPFQIYMLVQIIILSSQYLKSIQINNTQSGNPLFISYYTATNFLKSSNPDSYTGANLNISIPIDIFLPTIILIFSKLYQVFLTFLSIYSKNVIQIFFLLIYLILLLIFTTFLYSQTANSFTLNPNNSSSSSFTTLNLWSDNINSHDLNTYDSIFKIFSYLLITFSALTVLVHLFFYFFYAKSLPARKSSFSIAIPFKMIPLLKTFQFHRASITISCFTSMVFLSLFVDMYQLTPSSKFTIFLILLSPLYLFLQDIVVSYEFFIGSFIFGILFNLIYILFAFHQILLIFKLRSVHQYPIKFFIIKVFFLFYFLLLSLNIIMVIKAISNFHKGLKPYTTKSYNTFFHFKSFNQNNNQNKYTNNNTNINIQLSTFINTKDPVQKSFSMKNYLTSQFFSKSIFSSNQNLIPKNDNQEKKNSSKSSKSFKSFKFSKLFSFFSILSIAITITFIIFEFIYCYNLKDFTLKMGPAIDDVFYISFDNLLDIFLQFPRKTLISNLSLLIFGEFYLIFIFVLYFLTSNNNSFNSTIQIFFSLLLQEKKNSY
ncbi:uncharacterized protein ASCRUDRAFT_75250, partial [Ascoidea rubescens DSM 1968]